jgi:hypothetical protein
VAAWQLLRADRARDFPDDDPCQAVRESREVCDRARRYETATGVGESGVAEAVRTHDRSEVDPVAAPALHEHLEALDGLRELGQVTTTALLRALTAVGRGFRHSRQTLDAASQARGDGALRFGAELQRRDADRVLARQEWRRVVREGSFRGRDRG